MVLQDLSASAEKWNGSHREDTLPQRELFNGPAFIDQGARDRAGRLRRREAAYRVQRLPTTRAAGEIGRGVQARGPAVRIVWASALATVLALLMVAPVGAQGQ